MTFLLVAAVALADGPADNLVDNVRPVPPKGAKIDAAVRAELKTGLAALQAKLAPLAKHPLLPDAEIYEKAVRYALDYDEMYVDKSRDDVKVARAILKVGGERADALARGEAPWAKATGLVVRGYRSKIDGSAQPYGLVIPANHDLSKPSRVDFWWHGRGEVLTELNFIDGRQKSKGEFTPDGAIVVHAYGRYCNANKFAGEIDSLEILNHMKAHYKVDESRLVARGFSMGGAACWQYAVHYPTLWCAAAPGAGFAETKEFLGNFQNETVKPTWYEEKLWRMYDATVYARNLKNLPTVAYSGENDRQKQAADIMERFLKQEGMTLEHILGVKAGHQYTAAAKVELNKRIDAIAAKGKPAVPAEIDFTTYTLRYNRCAWLEVLGLEKHWEKATVWAKREKGTYQFKPVNVTKFAVTGQAEGGNFEIVIDEEFMPNVVDAYPVVPPPGSAAPPGTRFVYIKGANGKWKPATDAATGKTPGLQGPIDDAFLSRFVMVTPTGTPLHEKTGTWAANEQAHAIKHWRQQFRGDAPTVADKDLTDEQIQNANLILWGDPGSNAVLAKVIEKLPIKWTKDALEVNGTKYDAATHAPVMIFPNPLNPLKYVVLNSGFTFREYDYLNNARQVSKLPDYAVIDVTTPPSSRWPGKVVQAGFFGEQWQFLPKDGQ